MIETAHPDLSGQHREIWADKPVIRTIYGDYYRRIETWLAPGLTLEIGGGSGNFKSRVPDAIALDIQSLPWLDVAADAHTLPFASGSIGNLVLVDTLHHLQSPYLFLQEASRILRPGGRLVMVEPAITPLSWLIYHFLHPEPVRLSEPPLAARDLDPARDPFDANQAIPTTLFGRHRDEFHREFPNLKLLHRERFAVLSYLLSGGFRPWSLLPARFATGFLTFERLVDKVLGPLSAFRLLIVIESIAPDSLAD